MAGTTEGERRKRGGRDWPKKCCGPGKYQHVKGCHPSRPKCRWRRLVHPKWKTCECGLPHYPHRVGTVDWKHGGACVKHREHDRIMFEMQFLKDWDTGDDIEPEEICAERYRDE